jgi:hypothetical protein
MLGPQPPRSAGKFVHTPQNNSESHTNSIAAATTQMMWSVALATTRASFASTARGLALWSQMLRAPIGPWSLLAGPLAHGATATSGTSTSETADAAAPAADSPDEEAAAFASYRSAGGHASAQVITNH